MIIRHEGSVWNFSVILVYCLKQGARCQHKFDTINQYRYPKICYNMNDTHEELDIAQQDSRN
jgi:hypothetical protein